MQSVKFLVQKTGHFICKSVTNGTIIRNYTELDTKI
jgi:hypothetical protein